MHAYTQALADHEVEIPETINTQTLVKDLAKEVRLVEVKTEIDDLITSDILFNFFKENNCLPFLFYLTKCALYLFRISFNRTLAALDLSFLVHHSPKLP